MFHVKTSRETCHLKYDASPSLPFFRSSQFNIYELSRDSRALCQDVARRGRQLGEFPRESRVEQRALASPPSSRFHETTSSSSSLALLLNTFHISLSLSLVSSFFVFSKTCLFSLFSRERERESARDPYGVILFFFFSSTQTRVTPVEISSRMETRNTRRIHTRAITGNKSGKIEWRDTIGYIARKRRPINNRR